MSEKRVVVIDHEDSFAWNLAGSLGQLGHLPTVIRTTRSLAEVEQSEPTHLVLSPGRGNPNDSDLALFYEALTEYQGKIPILGVCLGLQAIAVHHGATVVQNRVDGELRLMHGKTSVTKHDHSALFDGIAEDTIEVIRYNSLVVDPKTCTANDVTITALSTDDQAVMAIKSRLWNNMVGVQFHPESHYTKQGQQLLANFLSFEM